MNRWFRFKHWLILKLGGFIIHDCKSTLWDFVMPSQHAAIIKACIKVEADIGLQRLGVSNLGRNIFRDEACEWAKIYLHDAGVAYRDSDVHLGCELWWHLNRRKADV